MRRLHRTPRGPGHALLHHAGKPVGGAAITTIEGLVPETAIPCRRRGSTCQAPQCGYCQSGQIMQAASMLKDYPAPQRRRHRRRADSGGNLCRCMAYGASAAAIKIAAKEMRGVVPPAESASALAAPASVPEVAKHA